MSSLPTQGRQAGPMYPLKLPIVLLQPQLTFTTKHAVHDSNQSIK
jgi:hypothetical protein